MFQVGQVVEYWIDGRLETGEIVQVAITGGEYLIVNRQFMTNRANWIKEQYIVE